VLKQNSQINNFIDFSIFNWLIDCCLTSSEQFFSYIQDDLFSRGITP
jgi:hypothetical protein